MSADELSPTPPTPDTPAPQAPLSFAVSLIVQETGRTHGVSGGAATDLIRDDDGNPETEYVLVANVNGVNVPLQSYSKSALDQLAASEQARQAAQATG